MTPLDVSSLARALKCLRQGLADAKQYPELRTVKDGVIKEFEFTVDLSWKLMQRYLQTVAQVDEAKIRTKNDLFREAAISGLIADNDRWSRYYAARNETAHTYDIDRSGLVFTLAHDIPADVDALLLALHERSPH